MSSSMTKIPFSDPVVKSYYEYFYLGMITGDYLTRKLKEIETDRIELLMGEGMPFGQALEEVIDDMYAIDVESFANVLPF